MSSSLNSKPGQSTKQVNVSGSSWFTKYELQSFTFPTSKKLDEQSDLIMHAEKEVSYIYPKLYFQQSH